MRRVLCDVFILVTTITSPTPAADCAALCLPPDPQAPPIDLPVDPPIDPPIDPPLGLDRAGWWAIYQEFIFVHCERIANNDDDIIESA